MKIKDKEIRNDNFEYDNEIDLISIAKNIWTDRKSIKNILLKFIGLGLVIALISPTEYTSSVVVKPILSDSKANLGGGSLGGLAAMAGIKIGESGNNAEIHPTLYPKIIESYEFQKELMQSSISVEKLNHDISFEKYYTETLQGGLYKTLKKYTLGLPSLIIKKIKSSSSHHFNSNDFNTISETDKELIRLLNDQIKVTVDEKIGFVSLSATMPEKLQAAQMVSAAQNILQRRVIEHKLEKVQEDLKFIEERHREKKNEFEKAQDNLAKYRDSNRNVNTAIAQTDIERLNAEFQLAFSVYSELAKQVETQKIQVKEISNF